MNPIDKRKHSIMRPSNPQLSASFSHDDWRDDVGVLPSAHRLRGRPRTHPGSAKPGRMGRRFVALGTLLCFFALLTASGPHLVHHLADLHPHGDHRPYADRYQPTSCVVFSLIQHTPAAESASDLLTAFLASDAQPVFDQSLPRLEASKHAIQARAPPV